MATHDYVIDNQTAPNFRADLNNALAAIVTQNSNATAPTVTYANMFWYDTANNQLKKRDEANSAWITLGTIDEGAGTFTPTGERALASQIEAETGTDNTKVMTPLRTAQAIDAQLGSSTAALAWGSVGTYALLGTAATVAANTTLANPGSTIAGSSLRALGLYAWVDSGGVNHGTALSGTWRVMGFLRNPAAGNAYEVGTLCLRIV
jgi:hypothetical protein